tara:strand:+ start:457 stop:2637 length:2181 start_codon:yes stop_codon:yes gene_type:complete
MLNRNKIFKTVRDTTNSLNVSTGKKMDNFYTELMTYEDMVQKRYDKIKDILNTIKYHHNKIQNLDKNYTNAIFGGGKTDIAKLMKDIDSAIDSIDILIGSDGIITKSKFDKLIKKKKEDLEAELDLKETNDKISKNNVKQEHKIFFETAHKELSEVKKEFDENRKYINDLVEKIKKIEDPINQYILDKKLSKDFRQSIKNGIRDLIKFVEIDSKNDFEQFNTYKNKITIGLGYAKEDEAENIKYENDPNATDDLKILQQIQKNKNNLEFHTENASRGYLRIPGPGSNKINFKIVTQDNRHSKIEFDNTDYIKTLYISIKRSGVIAKDSITKEYYLDIDTVKRLCEKPKLLSYISKIKLLLIELLKNIKLNKIKLNATNNDNNEVLPKLIDQIKNLYEENFFDDKLDEILFSKIISSSLNIEQKLNEIKKKLDKGEEVNNSLIKWFNDFYDNNKDLLDNETTTKTVKGGNNEKLKESAINALQVFKKIRKQIEEDYDKEHNSTNKPQEPKTNQPKQNDIVKSAKTMFGVDTQQEDEDNKITNSIISSIIENYEKERSSVNTIEDKIKLDTKFVDILDNLGLNLADIFKINFEDKLAFIFFILILHIVVYSIIESLIMNDYLTDIVYIMAVYVGVYFLIMFILILILNKYVNYRMKSVLNYLNIDFNMQLITMHLFIVFMFYIIVLILSQHIDIFVAKEEDDKLQILYRIEVISSIIFIFSSVFVMLL